MTRRRVPVDESGEPVLPAASEGPLLEEESCDCPRLDPEEWDAVESDWSDMTFLRASSTAVLGVPTGMARTRDDLRARAVDLGATVPEDAMVLLGEGQFRRPVLLEVEDAPEHKEIWRPGGFAYSRLFDAPLGTIRKLVRNAELDAKMKFGRAPASTWLWYLTCRVCSKERNFETLVVFHFEDAS